MHQKVHEALSIVIMYNNIGYGIIVENKFSFVNVRTSN